MHLSIVTWFRAVSIDFSTHLYDQIASFSFGSKSKQLCIVTPLNTYVLAIAFDFAADEVRFNCGDATTRLMNEHVTN